jgi:hypothetical protein
VPYSPERARASKDVAVTREIRVLQVVRVGAAEGAIGELVQMAMIAVCRASAHSLASDSRLQCRACGSSQLEFTREDMVHFKLQRRRSFACLDTDRAASR